MTESQSSEPIHPSGQAYAGWWQRAGAELIDGLIISAPTAVLAAVLGLGFVGWGVVSSIAGFFYNAVLDGGPAGQTFGKMALRIQTRDDETGGSIGSGRGAGRAGLPFVLNLASRV